MQEGNTFGVFFDAIVTCAVTVLMSIASGLWHTGPMMSEDVVNSTAFG